MATYTIHVKDDGTGIVMEWRGMPQEALDWFLELRPDGLRRQPSEILVAFGPPAHTFFELEPPPTEPSC